MSTDWIAEALETHETPLLRYVSRLVSNPDAAREIVQETFLKLCKTEPESTRGHVREWLFTVARNLTIDRLRREKPTLTLDEGISVRPEGTTETPSRVVERRLQAARVLHLLGELTADQQEVVRLKFQEEMSYGEIARITGHSTSNVGYLIHVAIRKLRDRLAEVREGSYGA